LRTATISFVMPVYLSVRPSASPYGTTWLPLDWFSLNLVSENFSKIWWDSSGFIKPWQEYPVLYMQTNIHFGTNLVLFFLNKKCSGQICREKTHILSSVTFFFRFWENVAKYCSAGQATDENMAHAHCVLYTWCYRHTRRICYARCFFPFLFFPTATRVHQRASTLRYTNCLVKYLLRAIRASRDVVHVSNCAR